MLDRCELCHVADFIWEDEMCGACYCKSHPDKGMVVLKRHTAEPTAQELEHIKTVAQKLWPGLAFRGPKTILDHFHWHQE